ncbi:hypothetical protein HK098_005685 [Nowakowskiella sp. JEL0407]|nr:hypothetical protein HK098_005685 [Nowakowskiella sp. JEL0407]
MSEEIIEEEIIEENSEISNDIPLTNPFLSDELSTATAFPTSVLPSSTPQTDASASITNGPDVASLRPTYDRYSLHWNLLHTTNQERIYCYCGKDRTLNELNVQCHQCKNFYHQQCLKKNIGRMVPFVRNYKFICAWCQDTEFFELNDSNTWKDIAVTAYCNLVIQKAKVMNLNIRLQEGEITENAVFPGDWTFEFRQIRDWCSQPHVWKILGIGKEQNFPVLRTVFSSYSKSGKQKQLFEEGKRPSGKVEWAMLHRDLFSFTPNHPSTSSVTPSTKRKRVESSGSSLGLSQVNHTESSPSASGTSTPTGVGKSPSFKKTLLEGAGRFSNIAPKGTVSNSNRLADCEQCREMREQNDALQAENRELKLKYENSQIRLEILQNDYELKEREIAQLSRILTVGDAHAIHGTNPQHLIEKIIRSRIYDSLYWKEHCFGLTAETLLDKAVQLQFIGGQYGNQKPTEFLCLTLKMLQLQPEKEIVIELLKTEEEKYLRALAAFYLRLTGSAHDIYSYLEPFLYDLRKLRRKLKDGSYDIIHMDEFIDSLLTESRVCDTILPRLTKRHVLEEAGELEPRVSTLEAELLELEEVNEKDEPKDDSISDHDDNDDGKFSGKNGKRYHDRDRPKYDRNEDSRDRRETNDRDEDSRDRRERNDRGYERSRDDRYRQDSRDDEYSSHRKSYRDRSRSNERRRGPSPDYDRRRRSRSPYSREDRRRDRSRSPDERQSKKWSSKKVDGLFKKSGDIAGEPEERKVSGKNGGGAAESLSIEETNKMREKLGLKPLK